MTRLVVALVALVALVVLAGCGTSDEPERSDAAVPTAAPTEVSYETVVPSSECEQAMIKADDVPGDLSADHELAATVEECATVDEWLSALALHPGALGLTDRATIEITSVRVVCYPNPYARVCRDAAARGIQF